MEHDAVMIHGCCSPHCEACEVEALRAENERLRERSPNRTLAAPTDSTPTEHRDP